MSAKTETDLSHSRSSIDQIREILFGEKIAEFEKRIAELQREYAQLKQSLDALTQNYAETVQVVGEHGQRIQQAETTPAQTDSVVESLRGELTEKINELAENKVDKGQIGQAFIDWGLKVKETVKK